MCVYANYKIAGRSRGKKSTSVEETEATVNNESSEEVKTNEEEDKNESETTENNSHDEKEETANNNAETAKVSDVDTSYLIFFPNIIDTLPCNLKFDKINVDIGLGCDKIDCK